VQGLEFRKLHEDFGGAGKEKRAQTRSTGRGS
jgi:hypothetical protein